MVKWLQNLFSTDDTASITRVMYALVILFVLGSLGIDMVRHGITDNWVSVVQWLLGAVAGTKIVGKFAEVKNDGQ